ncbi:MAG: homoserine kinase, partial [Oscillospiraceae bacterium]
MIKIQIPATSANLGAGFDALGLALTYYNYVNIEESDCIEIKSLDGRDIPLDETNLVYESAKSLYDICGKPFH